jgi:hypothetical protein
MNPRTTQIPAARGRRFTAAVPAVPPVEVLAAIQTAADVYDRLLDSGRRVHFEFDPKAGSRSGSGNLTIQILDTDGDVLGILSPGELLELALGAPLH